MISLGKEAEDGIDILAFRLVIIRAISSEVQRYPLIDWEQVTKEAFDDVRNAYVTDKSDDCLSSYGKFEWLVVIPGMTVIVPVLIS